MGILTRSGIISRRRVYSPTITMETTLSLFQQEKTQKKKIVPLLKVSPKVSIPPPIPKVFQRVMRLRLQRRQQQQKWKKRQQHQRQPRNPGIFQQKKAQKK